MTTATDWDDATWTDTGEIARVTDVTSAATPGTPVRWVARTPDHLHDDLCRKVQPGEYVDEPTPHAGPAPDTADLAKRIDMHLASYRLMRHQETKAELWHAEASRMWAEQGVTSRVSERYTDRREALLSAYEAECERIKAGLARAPAVEYGGHVYDEERGYVEAGQPHRQDWTEREQQDDGDQSEAEGSIPALGAAVRERRAALASAHDGHRTETGEPERRGRLRRMWDAIRTWDGTGA